MSESSKPRPSQGWSPTVSQVDAAVAIVIMLFGALVVYSNYQLGASWGSDGPESGYFPFYIGLFILVSSGVTLYQALFGPKRNSEEFVEPARFKLVITVLIPTMVYVLAINFLGIYVASTLFIAAFMMWLGKYGFAKTALVSVGVSAVFFWLFEVQFLVALPKGPLEAYFGY